LRSKLLFVGSRRGYQPASRLSSIAFRWEGSS